jgi:excinuclease ABC subunit C
MGIAVPVFGMVKDGRHKTRAITTGGREIALADSKPVFALVTKIQDEAHRFAVAYHHNKRRGQSLAVEITGIKGIGERRAQKLFSAYKTREEFKKAAPEEIAAIAGVNAETAARVYEFIHGG